MELYELIVKMKVLKRRLAVYEETYGVLSQNFYKALIDGELERFGEYDKTQTDFSRWKGIYEIWLRRKQNFNKSKSTK